VSRKKPNRDAELEKQVGEQSAELVKKGPGGKRPGAGRKPNFLKRSRLPPMSAHIILAHFDQVKLWSSVLNSKSDDVRLRALQYLVDREQGKAPDRLIADSASSINVEFVAAPGVDAQELRVHFTPENSVEPEPVRELPALPEPKAKVVGLLCVRHGEYVLPINAKSDMCPTCIQEAAEAERRLFSLLPNSSV